MNYITTTQMPNTNNNLYELVNIQINSKQIGTDASREDRNNVEYTTATSAMTINPVYSAIWKNIWENIWEM